MNTRFLRTYVVMLINGLIGLAFFASCAAGAQTASASYVLPVTVNGDITSALQTAILHAGDSNGSNGPATIQIPAGTFAISGTLTFPGTRPLRIIGTGKGETTLCWYTDLGAGKYAIDANPGAYFPMQLSDMTLQGPNKSSKTGSNLGFAPSQMYGIHATDRADIENCSVGGFYAGVVVDGNHHIVRNCTIGDDYYGLYWIKSSDNSYADDYVGLCDLTGNRFASVAGDSYAPIACMFERDHTGFEPYCFYREPGTINDGNATWLAGCTFTVCQFEGYGNADFYDASGASYISECTFRDCGGYGMRYGFAIPAANAASGIAPAVGPSMTVGGFDANTIIGQGPTPGDMVVGQLFNNTWNMPYVLQMIASGQIALPTVTAQHTVYGNVIHDRNLTATLMQTTAAIAANQPVEISSGFYGSLFTVKPAAGVKPIAGVCLVSTAYSGCAVVGTHGVFSVSSGSGNPSFALSSPVAELPSGTLAASGGALVGYLADNADAAGAGQVNVFVNSVEL